MSGSAVPQGQGAPVAPAAPFAREPRPHHPDMTAALHQPPHSGGGSGGRFSSQGRRTWQSRLRHEGRRGEPARCSPTHALFSPPNPCLEPRFVVWLYLPRFPTIYERVVDAAGPIAVSVAHEAPCICARGTMTSSAGRVRAASKWRREPGRLIRAAGPSARVLYATRLFLYIFQRL